MRPSPHDLLYGLRNKILQQFFKELLQIYVTANGSPFGRTAWRPECKRGLCRKDHAAAALATGNRVVQVWIQQLAVCCGRRFASC